MVRWDAASLVWEFEVLEAFYKRNYPKGLGFVGQKEEPREYCRSDGQIKVQTLKVSVL